jgi:hypothetical protein
MRLAGHAARKEKREVHTAFWLGILMERDTLEDLGINWRVILKWIFRQWDEKAWT